jgi:hypothetical protein
LFGLRAVNIFSIMFNMAPKSGLRGPRAVNISRRLFRLVWVIALVSVFQYCNSVAYGISDLLEKIKEEMM